MIKQRIDTTLNDLLSDIYEEKGITTGDITPGQAMDWDKYVIELSKLFEALIEQNTEVFDNEEHDDEK